MQIEEFGSENDKTIVMLHGANFVHSFGRQYRLAKTYHIIVPHIMGFGAEAHRVFDTETCVKELASYIETLGKKVTLIGFSLGAQLAFKLVSECEYLFDSAILVSPWLIKEEKMLSEIFDANLKQLHSLKKKWLCHIVGMMNGMFSLKVRRDFVEQMQNVTEETIRNIVYNNITLDSVPNFENITIPITVLVGGKEQQILLEGAKEMAKKNSNCKYEIWEKAGHNIPPMFAKRFNALICSVVEDYKQTDIQ